MSISYSYDCPVCGREGAAKVEVHFANFSIAARQPKLTCKCKLSAEERRVLMDDAIEDADEDAWEWMTPRQYATYMDRLDDDDPWKGLEDE